MHPVILLLLSFICLVTSQHLKSSVISQTALPTVTVRGFLNFRTTVDGTVIVFTPASAAVSESVSSASVVPQIQSTESPQLTISTKSSLIQEISPTKVPEVIEPTQASTQHHYPTGLVTVLGGTIVKNGETTVHETKVIGTYIDGKYAQILQSTARVHAPLPVLQTPTIRPTQTQSFRASGPSVFVESPIKKAYVMAKEEPKTPDFDDNNSLQSYRKPEPRRLHPRLALNPLRSRWTQTNLKTDEKHQNDNTSKVRSKARLGTRRFTLPPRASPRVRMNRFKAKLPATQLEEQNTYNTKIQSRIGQQKAEVLDTKTEDEIQSVTEKNVENLSQSETKAQIHDLLPLEPVEDIDPSKVVKEVQTITSEVTQHVEGNQIQVKTLTLTTTIQRTLHPSEFETDIIVPTIPVDGNDVDASTVQETPPLVISRTYSVTERSMRTTVVPIFDGTSTLSHTVTESFFIRKLITAYKTLPPGDIFLLETASLSANYSDENNDLSVAEQSIHPSLFEGAIEITEEPDNELPSATAVVPLLPVPTLDPSLNLGLLANNQFDLNNPLLLAAALQNPQLAAVYLGLQQLKQQATQYNTITRPSTYVTTDTVYNTKVVSFYDGRSTRTRTLVEPAGTTERVVSTYTTEVMPVVNNNMALQQLQAQAQLQNVFGTQLIAPQFQMTPQMSTVTKTITTVTDSTSTKTKVYTLVYNAFSTRYRTVTSTSIVPTTITTVITSTVPLQMANTASPFNIFG